MDRFRSQRIFTLFGHVVATSSITLQVTLLYFVWGVELELAWQVGAFLMAYILTDFLNGLIHMIMDHREEYDAFYGPLVANFHLHHQTPLYRKHPLPVVYFHETGAKVWLTPYLGLVLFFLLSGSLSPFVLHTLVYIGILSSVAEVSHYLCHTSRSKTARLLSRYGLLLSMKHHAPHHNSDNMNYAFLNGMSDPLINIIAKVFFRGYKTTTDVHFEHYIEHNASGRG